MAMTAMSPNDWSIFARSSGTVACASIPYISAKAVIRFEAGKSTHEVRFGKRLMLLNADSCQFMPIHQFNSRQTPKNSARRADVKAL
jgi:hypothetical protein